MDYSRAEIRLERRQRKESFGVSRNSRKPKKSLREAQGKHESIVQQIERDRTALASWARKEEDRWEGQRNRYRAYPQGGLP